MYRTWAVEWNYKFLSSQITCGSWYITVNISCSVSYTVATKCKINVLLHAKLLIQVMELHNFHIKYSRHCVDGVLHLIMKKRICETSYNLVQYLNVHWRDNLSSKSMSRTHNMLMLNLNSCKCDSKYWITVICFIIELLFVFSKELSHHLIIIIKKIWVPQWYLTATVFSGFEEATLSFKKKKGLWMMAYEAYCMWTSMMMSLQRMWTRSSKNRCRERPLFLSGLW